MSSSNFGPLCFTKFKVRADNNKTSAGENYVDALFIFKQDFISTHTAVHMEKTRNWEHIKLL